MNESEENIGEDVTLKVDFYETSATTALDIAEMRDKYLRRSIAKKRGLSPDVTWEEINRRAAETTRMFSCRSLSMDLDTPWDKIVEEERKRR